MPFAKSGEASLYYKDVGEGTPIITTHGAMENTLYWSLPGVTDRLVQAGYRVISTDMRGHGLTQADDGYNVVTVANDFAVVADHLGLDRAYVMGFSMGARICAFLTIRHPDRVRSAIFGGLGANMVRPMAGTGPIAAALEADSIDDVTNATARTFRAFAEATKSDLKALACCIRASREPIKPDDLKQIICPVLVAVGSDDVIGGPASDLAKLIPQGEALEIVGRDHMKSVGDPTYKAGVIDFLGRRS